MGVIIKRIFILIIATCALSTFSGCPDYSHLRDVPDYESMKDGGESGDSDNSEID